MTDGLSAGAPPAARRVPIRAALGALLLVWAAARIALEFAYAVWGWYGSPLVTLADMAVILLPAAGGPAAAGIALIRPHHLPRRVGITFAVIRIIQALGVSEALVSGGTGGLLSWTGFYVTFVDAFLAVAIIVLLVRLRPPAPAMPGAPPRMSLPGRLVGVALALAGASIVYAALQSIGSAEETDYWRVLAYPWVGRFLPAGFVFTLLQILLSLQALTLSFGYGAALIASGFGLALRRRWGIAVGGAITAWGFAREVMALFFVPPGSAGTALHLIVAGTCVVGFLYAVTSAIPRRRKHVMAAASFPEPPAVTSTIPDDDASWHKALIASLADAGQQPVTRNLSGLILPIAALVVIAILTAFVDLAIREGMRNDPDWVQFTARYIWTAISVLVVGRAIGGLSRRIWQRRARNAAAELARDASRRPTLYLRAFGLDAVIGQPSPFELILGGRPVANVEQELVKLLGKVGPVIAIGRPGEPLPALGAARFYVDHDRWHLKVADAARVSRFVVWATGTTDGLRWELGHLLSQLPPERLIVWAHPHILGGEREEREAEWQRFRATLGKLFPKPFPERLGAARFFHFDTEFNPIPALPTPRRWYTPWRWLRPQQQSALRNLLIAKGTPPFDPETVARKRRIRRRIIAAVAAVIGLAVIALATLIALEFMRVSRDFAERRWNLLALDLVNAEIYTEGSVDANGEWRQTLRTTEQIQSALTAVPLRLEDRLFAEDSWNNAPYGQLADLRPVAEAYRAIFEAARQDPAVEKLLLVRASVIITADLASVADAEHRLAAVGATLAALDRFDALWQAVPQENRTGWTGPERLEKLIPLRRALLLAQQTELKAFIDAPDAWQSAPGDSGPSVTYTDQAFAARAEPLRQAEIDAYTALVQELNGMVNQ